MIELSLVLPVHNEEKGIESVINNIVQILKEQKLSYEILTIENGSIDHSLKKLQKLKIKYPHIKIYQSKKGWGNAVREGIRLAQGKYLCYMVSDGQISPKHIVTIIDTLKKNRVDLVKITRKNRENLIRKVNSIFYNLFCYIIFGVGNDINATPKILRRSLVKRLNLESENIALDLELLLKLKKNNLKWIDIAVPSQLRDRGKSSTNIKSALEMIKCIVRFRRNNF